MMALFGAHSESSMADAARGGVSKGLHFIQSNPFLCSLFTEVFGCNVPKVLLVGSEKERHEQFIMQFLNTIVIWGGGFVYDKGLEKAVFQSSTFYDAMQKGIGQAEHIKDAKEWHAIGKTAGLFGLVVPWMFTLPFLRNAFTVWSTGATNLAQVSGLQAYDRDDPTHQRQEEKALHKNLSVFATSNLAGVSLGLVGAIAGRKGMDQAMRGEAVSGCLNVFRSVVRSFDKGFKSLPLIGSKDPKASVLFKDGQFSQFDGLPLVASWILPGYGGYLAAIRDPVEAFENIGNTIIALVSFEAGPSWLRNKLQTSMEKNPNNPLVRGAVKNLGSVQNTGQLSKMLLSTVLYGMLPTALNLVTRPLRAQMAGFKDEPIQQPVKHQPDAMEVENLPAPLHELVHGEHADKDKSPFKPMPRKIVSTSSSLNSRVQQYQLLRV